jgi:DNA-binding IclR family transcriptional regulator
MITKPDARKHTASRPVQSVLRALAIVDALAAHPQGATPKGLSAELGLHLSTTYHLLNTLVATGYVARNADSRLFHIGPRIPYLQHLFQQGLAISPGVTPFLSALQQATGETVHLGRLLGNDMVLVAVLPGSRPDAVPAGYVGYSTPAHVTALGLVLLAWSPPDQIASYLERADLTARPPYKATTSDLVRQRLRRIRADGHALDPDDQAPGLVGCVAAPICFADDSVDAAVALLAPIARHERDKARSIAAVLSIARAASEFTVRNSGADNGRDEALTPLSALARQAAWVGARMPIQRSGKRGHRHEEPPD